MKKIVVRLVHEGRNPNTQELEELVWSSEWPGTFTRDEAVHMALVRTQVERASMATRITKIEVSQ